MTEDEFQRIYLACSEQVADQFYPKVLPEGPNPGRGEFLAFQAVLFSKLTDELKRLKVIA